MILSKKDLYNYLYSDMRFYYEQSQKERFINFITKDPIYFIAQYIRFLRKEEYYFNVRKDKLGRLAYFYYLSRKNKLGNRLGFKIPKNCFDAGLTIYHHGEVIVNESSKIGKQCKLHGGNCIGNDGKKDIPPVIGDGLDMGIGSKIIGNIVLGNNIKVGANAVVTKSFEGDNLTLLGIPAHIKE